MHHNVLAYSEKKITQKYINFIGEGGNTPPRRLGTLTNTCQYSYGLSTGIHHAHNILL